MHVHVSAVEFLVTSAYIILFGFLWRWIAAQNAGNKWGQAMAYIF